MAAVAAGASGFSANSQAKAQNAAIEARNRVMEANRRRNEELQRQAAEQTAKATNAAANSSNPASVNQAQEDRREDLSAVNAAPAVSAAPAIGGKSSAPKVVQTEIGRKVAEAGRRNTERTGNTAAIGGYSNLATDQAVATADATRGVNKISDFAGGWERLLPIQLQAATNNAARKGQTGRMIADIVGAIGSAGVQAGAQGIGPSFGSLFGASGPPGMYAGGTGTNPMTGLRFGGV